MARIRQMRKARCLVVGVALVAALLGTSAGISSASQARNSNKPLKVALILEGPDNDNSYNQVGYEGFESAQHHFGSAMQSTVEQNVPDESGVRPGGRGFDWQRLQIVLLSMGPVGRPTLSPWRRRHPGIRIEEFESAVTAKNYGAYNINYAEPSYIVGMMLAAASKTGLLGMVTSFPFPGILAIVDGMELGARAVNAKATMHVTYVSSFDDPAKETLAAQALVGSGVDALADVQDDAATCLVAQKDNVPCTDQNLVKSASTGPTTYLASYFYDFTPIYEQVIADVLAKKSVPKSIFEGWRQGADRVGSFGPKYDKLVRASIRARIASKEAALKAGKFQVFQGPIFDQQGKLKVPAGKSLTASQILSLNWVVKGVIGKQ